MRRFGSFLLGFIIGGLAVFGGLRYHVLRTDGGVELVPKLSGTFQETYVDIRAFTVADWTKHKAVVAAILQAGKGHLLQGAAVDELRRGADQLLGELSRLSEGS